MLIRDFLPGVAVSGFVQCYRIIHFEFDTLENIPIKAYPPKPEQCLHFFLRDPLSFGLNGNTFTQPYIFLSGQRTSLVKHLNGCNMLNVQVVFQPTAIFRLTGIPAYQLTDQNIDASFIFDRSIQTVFEQLQVAKSYREMLEITEHFIHEQISHVRKDVLPLDLISSQMIQQSGNISIDRLAKISCLCTKQFERKFYERCGVNPKAYAKIIRFNKAFNFKNCLPDKSWSYIAAQCGYFDYQHLVKDYKDFTGFNPPEFHLLESHSPESVLGLTRGLYRDRFNMGNRS